jgi:hypothetical protein
VIGNRVGTGARERIYVSTTDTYDETSDLDYIAIEYALNGEPVELTAAEKLHAARILHARGYSDTVISKRVQASRSTVTSWRESGWKPGWRPAPAQAVAA